MSRLNEFVKRFNALSHRHSKGKLFADFAEIVACAQHQRPYHTGLLERGESFERVEKAYLKAVEGYSRDELDGMAELFSIATLALHETPHDFLGKAFIHLEIANERSGQFFTPPELQRMMAEMILHDAGQIIAEKGFITVSEPAAGSGGMVIEVAETLRRQGHAPERAMWFQATDIDRTCFNMAYFQLSALGLCGEVIHGDTLRMQHWDRRNTPRWQLVASREGVAEADPPAVEKPVPMSVVQTAEENLRAIVEAPAKPMPARQLSLDL